MKLELNPLQNIPEQLREDYKNSVARCIQARLRTICLTAFVLFTFAMIFHSFTENPGPLAHRLQMFAILTAGVGLVLYFNRCAKCITSSKLTAFLFTCLVLFLLNYGPMNKPASFAYAPHMLSLVFAALMFPWFLRDVAVITTIHYTAWFIYYLSRDVSHLTIPATAFGSDPFVNGTVFMTLTAILCVIIRYKDNLRDIHNFVLLKETQSQKQQMERELEFAACIQNTLVPQSFESPRADVFVTYQPVSSIGGDYAHFRMAGEDHLIFFIGDVTGHGVPAALMVNRLHSEFDRLAASGKHPGQILNELNQFIVRAFSGTHMYLTAFCGMVAFKENRIYYSNYGHPPQYVFRLNDSSVVKLEALTSLLGIDLDEGRGVYENYIEYCEGDRIFLFTDGILELKNKAREEYGDARLQAFIQTHADENAKDLHARLMKSLLDFGGGRFNDDVFVISIKCKAGLEV